MLRRLPLAQLRRQLSLRSQRRLSRRLGLIHIHIHSRLSRRLGLIHIHIHSRLSRRLGLIGQRRLNGG